MLLRIFFVVVTVEFVSATRCVVCRAFTVYAQFRVALSLSDLSQLGLSAFQVQLGNFHLDLHRLYFAAQPEIYGGAQLGLRIVQCDGGRGGGFIHT